MSRDRSSVFGGTSPQALEVSSRPERSGVEGPAVPPRVNVLRGANSRSFDSAPAPTRKRCESKKRQGGCSAQDDTVRTASFFLRRANGEERSYLLRDTGLAGGL